jgi:hypothetical protein
MAYNQIIAAIKAMRDRESLSTIISAAEARDSHLANIETELRRKRLWAKFSHIKVGDSVFVHKQPEGKLAWLWGKQLVVKQVKPRVKEIVIRGGSHGSDVALTAFMMDAYKLSLTPTTAAFAHALKGDDSENEMISRKAKR